MSFISSYAGHFDLILCVCVCVCVYIHDVVQALGCIQLFVTPWMVTRQAPLSMGFF